MIASWCSWILMPALLFAEPSYNGKTQSHWLRAMNHPAATERVAAITALMNLMSQGRVNPTVLTALRRATEDEDARVRLAATEVLGDFGADRGLSAMNASSPTGTMSALAKRLGDDNANVRDAAVTALAKQGMASRQQLLPILAPILNRGTPNSRRGALLVLAQWGDDVQLSEELRISVLRSARDPDAAIRRAALRALAITPPRPDAAQLLLGMFSSNDEEIRENAAYALSAQTIQGGRLYLAPMTKALQSKDPAMAQGALDAVAAMGKEVPKELVEPTARLLHDDRTPLRRHAAATLGAIGKAGPNVAITALVKRYPAEQVVEVRAEIVKALGRIGEDGPKLVMDYLLAYAKDPSRVVRQAVATSLECAAGHRPETTPASLALAGLLQDESADVRRAAAEALGQFSEVAPNVLAALDRASMDSDPQVRTLAAESAATIRASLKQTN